MFAACVDLVSLRPERAVGHEAPAPGTALVDRGVLIVSGTDKADSILVSVPNGAKTGQPSSADYQPIRVRINGRIQEFSEAVNRILVKGGDGDDQIAIEGSVAAEVYGDNGNDRLIGGTNHDILNGGEGNDVLSGADGNDVLYGAAGDDLLTGGNGDDTIRAESGSDTLEGEGGNDYLRGGLGPDIIRGGEGDDHLEGHDRNWCNIEGSELNDSGEIVTLVTLVFCDYVPDGASDLVLGGPAIDTAQIIDFVDGDQIGDVEIMNDRDFAHVNQMDVDGDSLVNQDDAQAIIDRLNRAKPSFVDSSDPADVRRDVDGNGLVTLIDALRVINYVNDLGARVDPLVTPSFSLPVTGAVTETLPVPAALITNTDALIVPDSCVGGGPFVTPAVRGFSGSGQNFPIAARMADAAFASQADCVSGFGRIFYSRQA